MPVSQESSEDCSIVKGIRATDINVRATWFINWSAFSSSARDFDSRATTALCRSCCARFFAVVYTPPDVIQVTDSEGNEFAIVPLLDVLQTKER